jgi:glutamine synthetase
MAVVESGPTQVQRVLAKGSIADPFPSLEQARSDPGRLEKIRQVRKLIDERGIKYIFFQQVSVSGHVNGKGVAATQWENVAEAGYQLVYGATADLFVDRHDRYIGFGPEESELAAVADLDTFAQLPWDGRVARVYCDCYDTESGNLLESDPRQNLKRIMNEVEQELGYTFLCGIEPEMMWMRKTDDPNDAVGLTKPWCYHINQFEELREIILDVIDYGEQLGITPTYGDHEDSPGQLELNFLFDRAVRTADNLSTYRHNCASVERKHGEIASFMPKPIT